MENYDFLNNPFNGLDPNDVIGIQNQCDKLAELLFNKYGIRCGDKTFRLVEFEFYYYKKQESGISDWNAEWNRETYPRNKNAGELFFHYSGADICFQCHFDEKERDDEYGEFGGILIRSILDGSKVLAGPLFCANAMLNACKKQLPELVPVDLRHCKFAKDLRCGIDSDKNQEKDRRLNLCYYVTRIDGKEIEWEAASERISWDKKNDRFKKVTRNYKKERNFI